MRISSSAKVPLLFAAMAIAGAAPADPVLTSSFPLGGTIGSDISVTIRGENLKDAYQVLFDCSELSAQVKDVQDLKPEAEDPKDPPASRRSYKPPRCRLLSLITPRSERMHFAS